AQKLLLKPGSRAALVNAPEGYAERLGPLSEGVVLTSERGSGLDFVQLFVHDRADLEQRLPAAVAALKPGGLLWVCYPKGGQKAGTDLHRDVLWGLLNEHGLTGV